MEWDYFISHASEDKPLVASPLAHYLRSVGFNVWYDRFTLRLGESLMAGIDNGLANSAFGIVVLSPSFFAKHWTQRELGGLMAVAEGERRILPIWHEVDGKYLARTSPMLADLRAVSTERGLNAVAEEVIRGSFPDRLASLPLSNTGRESSAELREAVATLTDMLNGGASRDDVFLLVSAYHDLLRGVTEGGEVVPASRTSGTVPFDFALVSTHGVTGPMGLEFIVLGPTEAAADPTELLNSVNVGFGTSMAFGERPYNDYLSGRLVGEFPAVRKVAHELAGLIESDNVHHAHPDRWRFTITLVNGRRDSDPSALARRGELASTSRIPLRFASYDRLTDLDVSRIRA